MQTEPHVNRHLVLIVVRVSFACYLHVTINSIRLKARATHSISRTYRTSLYRDAICSKSLTTRKISRRRATRRGLDLTSSRLCLCQARFQPPAANVEEARSRYEAPSVAAKVQAHSRALLRYFRKTEEEHRRLTLYESCSDSDPRLDHVTTSLRQVLSIC